LAFDRVDESFLDQGLQSLGWFHVAHCAPAAPVQRESPLQRRTCATPRTRPRETLRPYSSSSDCTPAWPSLAG